MKTDKQPNLLLITADQLRADCLSIAGHPDLTTPNLDQLAGRGAWFTEAYSPAPICAAARRSIMTGCSPFTDGCSGNNMVRILRPQSTLPNLLRVAGYQTAEIGRSMHQYPSSARYGFEVRENSPFHSHDSHVHWTIRQTSKNPPFNNWPHALNHGMAGDGYGARSWPYDEAFHQTTWTVNKAVEFLDRRDVDVPYFAHVGFVAPHPPLVPPQTYFERFLRRELTPPVAGDWAVAASQGKLQRGAESGWIPHGGPAMHETLAGYYGLVQHLDAMLFNLLRRVRGDASRPTYILFCSDHGEMLGDHYMFRKLRPYQGSMHVPLMLFGPGIPEGCRIDQPVTLEDILPTFCELAGVAVPGHVEGRSLMPLINGDSSTPWRPFVHSEMGYESDDWVGWHALTDGKWKFIWYSKDGCEQLFDLRNDPRELHDLSRSADHAGELERWRRRLVEHLQQRKAPCVAAGRLEAGHPHPYVYPHALPV